MATAGLQSALPLLLASQPGRLFYGRFKDCFHHLSTLHRDYVEAFLLKSQFICVFSHTCNFPPTFCEFVWNLLGFDSQPVFVIETRRDWAEQNIFLASLFTSCNWPKKAIVRPNSNEIFPRSQNLAMCQWKIGITVDVYEKGGGRYARRQQSGLMW